MWLFYRLQREWNSNTVGKDSFNRFRKVYPDRTYGYLDDSGRTGKQFQDEVGEVLENRTAKKSVDYIFRAELVEHCRNELIAGEFDAWDDYHSAKDGRFELGTALLELGWCDIELNINSAVDGHGRFINKIAPAYFICLKGKTEEGDEDWSPAGYIDDFGYKVCVDWGADNWKEQLEKDMFENLMKAVKRFDIKIDEPNWEGEGHAFDVFDRLMDMANHGFYSR